MMKYQNTITTYEAIEKLTSQMLLAAKAEDWDKLTALESDCAKYIEQLKFYENVLPLSKDASQLKAASIKRILADDREIRNLVSPKMAKLSALMNSSQNGKKLNRTYGK
jgi:flagellar protein FliT